MDFRDLYKILRAPTLGESVGKRTQNVIAERHEKQREHFWSKRLQSQTSPPTEQILAEKKKNPRAEMLKKWREEKLKKIEEEKKNKKPIFKVGVVHRKATGSPLLTNTKTLKKKPIPVGLVKENHTKNEANNLEERQGVITRARARNIKILNADKKPKLVEVKATVNTQEKQKHTFCKIEKGKKKPFVTHEFNVPESVAELPYSKKLTYPYSPKMSSRCSKGQMLKEKNLMEEKENEERADEEKENMIQVEVVDEKVIVQKEIEKEIKAEHHEPKPSPVQGNTTPKKPSTPTLAETESYVPIHYSPFVTVRSSRKSGRKAKRSLVIDIDAQIEKEENEFRCRIFSFRRYIECETKRLQEESNKWRCIYQEFPELPSDVEGEIDSVIGKTNLLTSDKFMQFKDLIDKCEAGDALIKIDDLQGFQDWVSIEVERIDEDFQKLKKRKCNDWAAEVVEVVKVKTKKTTFSKNPIKRPIGKSNIRSHILAARKLLKEGNPNGSPGCKFPIFANEDALKVATPVRKQSLLKDVLSSGAKRKNGSSVKKSPAVRERRNSGLEIMIATQKNKLSTSLVNSRSSNVPINYEVLFSQNQTPSRGILKNTPRTVNSFKGNVTFLDDLEKGRKGLDDKYFKPSGDDSESSPFRIVLGDLKNTTPRISTRSQTRLAASTKTVV